MNLKTKITTISFAFAVGLSAQTGVGINMPTPQATLDIQPGENGNNGVLFPNVNQFSPTDPSTAQNGMLVFLDRTFNEGAGFEGLYFWDAEEEVWQYIFQSKMLELNLFKTIIEGVGFPIIAPGNENTGVWFKTNFTSIEAPDGNYKLQNGDLVIGKSGLYSLLFTGGIYKEIGSTSATSTEVGIFLDNNSYPSFNSLTPLPSADNGNRSVNHTISGVVFLNKGQVLSVKTRRLVYSGTNTGPDSNYSLILSYLD